MGAFSDYHHHNARRFVVRTPILELGVGLYACGDVVTERALGGMIPCLLESGVVCEGDYHLSELFDDIEAAPPD